MSPSFPPLDDLSCTHVPAKVQVWLFKEAPTSIQQRPDFVCDIEII